MASSLCAAAAVLAAAVAYGGILRGYFVTDDWAWLFIIANWPLHQVVLLPMGGHSLIARNALFAGLYGLFGPDPVPFFVTVLGAHLANVLLLYRIIRLGTGSAGAACFGATLWGTSPAYAETLAWYSASGQAFATTCGLLVLARVLHRRSAGTDLTPADVACCAGLLLLGMQFFGVGVVFAAAFPIMLGLLPATRWHRRVLVLTVALLLAYGVGQVVTTRLLDLAPTLGATVRALLRDPWPAVACTFHLVRVGVATLVVGSWWMPAEAIDGPSSVLAGTVVLGGMVAFAVAPAGRRPLAVFALLALGTYAVIAAVRAPIGAEIFSFRAAWLGVIPRFQYTGQAMLAVVVVLIVVHLGRSMRLPVATGRAVLAAWVALLGTGYLLRRPPLDTHARSRVETRDALDAIRTRVARAAPGETVHITSQPFAIGWLPWTIQPPPGWAALFTIFFPSDELDGRRVRFVVPDGERVPRAPAGSRIATVLGP